MNHSSGSNTYAQAICIWTYDRPLCTHKFYAYEQGRKKNDENIMIEWRTGPANDCMGRMGSDGTWQNMQSKKWRSEACWNWIQKFIVILGDSYWQRCVIHRDSHRACLIGLPIFAYRISTSTSAYCLYLIREQPLCIGRKGEK